MSEATFAPAIWLLVASTVTACEPSPSAETAHSASPSAEQSAPTATSRASAAPSATSTSNPEWDPGSGVPVRVAITASADGFVPEVAEFVQGRPAFLDFERTDDASCANAVRMPWAKEAIDLPKGKKVSIRIPDTSQAGEFAYACWMNMLRGKVVIKPAADGG